MKLLKRVELTTELFLYYNAETKEFLIKYGKCSPESVEVNGGRFGFEPHFPQEVFRFPVLSGQ
jgi:hypothetical protein